MADVGQEGTSSPPFPIICRIGCSVKYWISFVLCTSLEQANLRYAEDFEAAKAKALKIGASACYVEDLREEFIKELCFPAVQCNAIYENVYLLGKSP